MTVAISGRRRIPHAAFVGAVWAALLASRPRSQAWHALWKNPAPRPALCCAAQSSGRLIDGDPVISGNKVFRLIVLDFDRTITRKHMYETHGDAPLSDIKISDNTFVDLPALRKLVAQAEEDGHEVAIATFGRRDVVEKAMRHAFGKYHGIAISTPADNLGAKSSYTRSALLGDKNLQLAALAGSFKVEPEQIFLLDDDARNVQKAAQAGMGAKHVPSGLTRKAVRQVLKIIEAKGCNEEEPEPERPPEPEGKRRRKKKATRLRMADGQRWVTVHRHTYKSLLEGNAEAGLGRHARLMHVALKPSRRFLGLLPALPTDGQSYAWKMYVASVESMLDGDLDRPDAVEPEAHTRYVKLRGLSVRGLLPHSLMPEDVRPTVTVLHADKVGAGDTEAPLRKVNEGLIFTLMDGDARSWVAKDTPVAVKRSFARTVFAALVALRKTGHVHADFKLDNVLYKGKEDPEWWLNDFDFVTPVGGSTPNTPPMQELVSQGLKQSLEEPLDGREDFFNFVLAYAKLDEAVTAEQQQRALDFVAQDASAMADFSPASFPQMGEFDPAGA